jgi:hypothetical protein
MSYFAIHAEKWLDGSTRIELSPDERACFTDIIARATQTGADPPGQIYFVNEEHLAMMVKDSTELLKRTLEKCKKFKKIKINQKKSENVFVLSVVKWERFQHVWMHQKAWRTREKAKKEAQKKSITIGTKKDNQNITGDVALADKIRYDNNIILSKEKKKNEDKNFPSSPIHQCLFLLKEFSEEGFAYPYDEQRDREMFETALNLYRNVDIVHETEEKINQYWKKNPGALTSKGKNPRIQLIEHFERASKYAERSA